MTCKSNTDRLRQQLVTGNRARCWVEREMSSSRLTTSLQHRGNDKVSDSLITESSFCCKAPIQTRHDKAHIWRWITQDTT